MNRGRIRLNRNNILGNVEQLGALSAVKHLGFNVFTCIIYTRYLRGRYEFDTGYAPSCNKRRKWGVNWIYQRWVFFVFLRDLGGCKVVVTVVRAFLQCPLPFFNNEKMVLVEFNNIQAYENAICSLL